MFEPLDKSWIGELVQENTDDDFHAQLHQISEDEEKKERRYFAALCIGAGAGGCGAENRRTGGTVDAGRLVLVFEEQRDRAWSMTTSAYRFPSFLGAYVSLRAIGMMIQRR
eukprot:Polyplicarium_translucidae@DN4242_c0_g1_i1.p3